MPASGAAHPWPGDQRALVAAAEALLSKAPELALVFARRAQVPVDLSDGRSGSSGPGDAEAGLDALSDKDSAHSRTGVGRRGVPGSGAAAEQGDAVAGGTSGGRRRRRDDADHHADGAAGTAVEAVHDPLLAAARAVEVSALVRLGRHAEAVEPAIGVLFGGALSEGAAVRVRTELAACARRSGVPRIALTILRPVLDSEQPPGVRADALLQYAGCLASLDRRRGVESLLAEADRLLAADQRLDADVRRVRRALACVRTAAHQRYHGDTRSALAAAREGLALLDRLTDPSVDGGLARPRLIGEIVFALLDTGDRRAAADLAVTLIAAPVRATSAMAVGMVMLAIATRVHLPAGRTEAGRALLAEAVRLGERHDVHSLLGEALTNLAEVEEQQGKLTDALDCLRRARAAESTQRLATERARTHLTDTFGTGEPIPAAPANPTEKRAAPTQPTATQSVRPQAPSNPASHQAPTPTMSWSSRTAAEPAADSMVDPGASASPATDPATPWSRQAAAEPMAGSVVEAGGADSPATSSASSLGRRAAAEPVAEAGGAGSAATSSSVSWGRRAAVDPAVESAGEAGDPAVTGSAASRGRRAAAEPITGSATEPGAGDPAVTGSAAPWGRRAAVDPAVDSAAVDVASTPVVSSGRRAAAEFAVERGAADPAATGSSMSWGRRAVVDPAADSVVGDAPATTRGAADSPATSSAVSRGRRAAAEPATESAVADSGVAEPAVPWGGRAAAEPADGSAGPSSAVSWGPSAVGDPAAEPVAESAAHLAGTNPAEAWPESSGAAGPSNPMLGRRAAEEPAQGVSAEAGMRNDALPPDWPGTQPDAGASGSHSAADAADPGDPAGTGGRVRRYAAGWGEDENLPGPRDASAAEVPLGWRETPDAADPKQSYADLRRSAMDALQALTSDSPRWPFDGPDAPPIPAQTGGRRRAPEPADTIPEPPEPADFPPVPDPEEYPEPPKPGKRRKPDDDPDVPPPPELPSSGGRRRKPDPDPGPAASVYGPLPRPPELPRHHRSAALPDPEPPPPPPKEPRSDAGLAELLAEALVAYQSGQAEQSGKHRSPDAKLGSEPEWTPMDADGTHG